MKSRGDVIKAMNICRDIRTDCTGCPYNGDVNEKFIEKCVDRLFNDAKVYLMDKPMKPVDTVGGNIVCGSCGRVIFELQYWDEHRMPDYCPWCGTRIGWEKE